MIFDWYQCSIRDKGNHVLEVISSLGDEVRSNDRVGKMYRYTQGFEVVRKDVGIVACVAMGGRNGDGHAHAWATGEDAPIFADLVRDVWPSEHLVTRVDSCQDFIDPNAYRVLRRVAKRIAKKHDVSFPKMQDDLDHTAGRTQYVGSKSSEYLGRIYEKGWEQWGKICNGIGLNPDPATASLSVPSLGRSCYPGDWVRAEIQARPKGEVARLRAAQASPEQVWTFTTWADEYAREALELTIERFYARSRRVPDDERAFRFMVQQYSRVLTRAKNDLGGWDKLGNRIGEVMAELESLRHH